MMYVDVDDARETFNSSFATLNLRPGAEVLFAFLYFTGKSTAGTGGEAAPRPDRRDRVLFQPPNLDEYVELEDEDGVDTTLSDGVEVYQGVVDVTALVKAAGPGEYGVANVQLGT